MMVSPIAEGDGELGNLSAIVCHADLLLPASSSSSLYPFATRVCGGASCSPLLPEPCLLIFFSACPADVGAVSPVFPPKMDRFREGASRWMGRKRANGEFSVEK
jgi:hypothetical protein